MKILSDVFDLIFPKTCFSCDETIQESVLCKTCFDYLKEFDPPICTVCGIQIKESECENCEENDFAFDKAFSVFEYNKVMRNLIHSFKYEEFIIISKFFASEIFNRNTFLNSLNDEVEIIPVPLHKVKKRERGFNQAEIFANDLSQLCKLKVNPHLIQRQRFTKTQTKLNKIERTKNINQAFFLEKSQKLKEEYLIVDDVFTTGSTVNEMSKLLKENGVKNVSVLTISRAKK